MDMIYVRCLPEIIHKGRHQSIKGQRVGTQSQSAWHLSQRASRVKRIGYMALSKGFLRALLSIELLETVRYFLVQLLLDALKIMHLNKVKRLSTITKHMYAVYFQRSRLCGVAGGHVGQLKTLGGFEEPADGLM
jgi:hypothetical protein